MMRQSTWKLLVALVVVSSVASASRAAVRKISENLVEVTVVGQGEDEQEALRDAKRKAVEQGAGTYIHSQSQTKDFVLVRDTILARSTGFLQSFVPVKTDTSEDDIWSVKIKAIVSIKGISDAWGVTTNLLKQMGRPKIMVFISEDIRSGPRRVVRTRGGAVVTTHVEAVGLSTVQTRIENLLLKSGFLLVDKKQVKAIDRKNIETAIAANNPAVIQAIAKQFGAQLFITGTANATASPSRTIAGRLFYAFEGVANVRCFRSDTAQLLSSIPSVPGMDTRGLKQATNTAAQQALDGVGKQIAPKVRNDILRFWQDALEGRGEVVLEVSGIGKFIGYVKLKKALKQVKGVQAVNGNFHNNVAKLSIESDTNAEKLAERIAEALEDMVEISDISQNVIKATYTKK